MPRIGYDFDGVVTAGHKPKSDDVVITGRPINQYFDIVRPYGLECPVYCFPGWFPSNQAEAALWKVEMIKRLSLTQFYEDDPVQFEFIKRNCPDLELVKV